MAQGVSRRKILTLTGTGLAAAAAIGRDAAAEPAARMHQERNYRALALPPTASIQSLAAAAGNRAAVTARTDRLAYFTDDELVIIVRGTVPDDLIGRRRVLSTFMIADSGDLRSFTQGSEITIEDSDFEVELVNGQSRPEEEWDLVPERIFAVRVTLNLPEREEFAISDDFYFKVMSG